MEVLKKYDNILHGADAALPDTEIVKELLAFTFESFAKFYDKYVE